ncbi:PH-domain-containing protein [Rhizopogon vinicolor AM-OR11-026]|uniref:PH-domain-containing protein n=1 Tax=Rhizopogon vinicolor AM-OR11-026 TaxID=1314800 RepID=A0A1B7NCE8_9AGAM|nr:PH-domain-containing protein [Rhizopogon vinicolor AM-OR11-026]
MTTSRSAPPPSPQEVQRKLSVHSSARPKKAPLASPAHVSGTESDSDSVVLSPDLVSTSYGSTGVLSGSITQPPLSSIAERRSGSGEESDEDEEEEEGGWRTANKTGTPHGSVDEKMIKSGYLWKKGERRKTWKKRWFVLRPAHLAYYKTNAEYQLLRLLDLSDVHSCTPVTLKKHNNTFGVVSAVRTFYLQAESSEEVHRWVQALQGAREALLTASTQTSLTTPIPIPGAQSTTRRVMVTHSPPQVSHLQNITSSDSEDASPSAKRTYSNSSQNRPAIATSPTPTKTTPKEASKIVLSGYLMKCGSKRHNWRKRWFVLNGEKLVYSGSHMDTKLHRQFSFSEILDALEFDMRTHKHSAAIPPPSTSPPSSSTAPDDSHGPHTFKIVTTKRTLLLCAPSEEEEIKWLSAIRALIARRSGAGVVPGDLSGSVGSALKPAASGGDAKQGPASSSGLRHKVRNLSISGPSGLPAAPISED